MKKLMLVAAMAALAVPGAAYAHKTPPKPAHRGPQAPTIAKNSAWACKALQAQDKTAFAKAFGTNGNLRNAYGKCVSAHAHSSKLAGATLNLHDITIASAGTITSAGASGCQFTDAGCTIASTGTVTGLVGGTYSSTWTILWKQGTSNGAGGYCAPATGTTTLSVPVIGTLTKSEKGTVCEVGPTGTNVEHLLKDGTFTVSSGTGYLATATGSGTVTFDQKPGTDSALGGMVSGSETFTDLTLKL